MRLASKTMVDIFQQRRQGYDLTADGLTEADAEKAVHLAAKAAEAAVSKAVQAAALAGLEYMPPVGMQLDTPRVVKVKHLCTFIHVQLESLCHDDISSSGLLWKQPFVEQPILDATGILDKY